jgi:PBP1b-binding outer membrane lipoprotein LpoB
MKKVLALIIALSLFVTFSMVGCKPKEEPKPTPKEEAKPAPAPEKAPEKPAEAPAPPAPEKK